MYIQSYTILKKTKIKSMSSFFSPHLYLGFKISKVQGTQPTIIENDSKEVLENKMQFQTWTKLVRLNPFHK